MSTPPPVWPPVPGSPSPFDKPPPRKSNPALTIALIVLVCLLLAAAYELIGPHLLPHPVPVPAHAQ